MAWDENKSTFDDRPDVPGNQKITATEWNNHVQHQKNHGVRPFTQVTTTASATANGGESHWVDTSGGNVTVTLPAPEPGKRVRVKHIADGGTGNTCAVSPNGTETIDGSGTNFTVSLDASYEFESDGTNWETH